MGIYTSFRTRFDGSPVRRGMTDRARLEVDLQLQDLAITLISRLVNAENGQSLCDGDEESIFCHTSTGQTRRL